MAHEYNPFTWTDNGDGLADNIYQTYCGINHFQTFQLYSEPSSVNGDVQ